MWRKVEPQAPSLPAQTKTTAATTVSQTAPNHTAIAPPSSSMEGRLTKSLIIEGDITGQDDLLIDGEVRGKILLTGGKLTIGPDGRVTAEIEAREVVVRGEVTGNIKAQDRVHIAATGRAKGEIRTRLISIEEGAHVHGVRVNLDREERARPTSATASDSQPLSKGQVPIADQISQVHA
jgi:cytoskeletal protein CcmA (bactofilin family)